MGVNPAYAGRVYPPSPVYEVGREKIREFAAAIGSHDPAHHDPAAARGLGHADVVAPPTFAVIVAQQCEAQLITDPEAGIDFSRVVHGEEKFAFTRPIVAGDRLVPTLHVEAMRMAGGHGMVTTRVELVAAPAGVDVVESTQGLEHVASVRSMLVVRGGE